MINQAISQSRLTYRLMRDERVPNWTKLIPIAVVVYLLIPIDLIPDVIPILGWIDDIAIFVGGLRLFEALVPDYIVYEHRAALGMEYS